MLQESNTKRIAIQKTCLYEPTTGCLYAHDLFEKDLYREKILESGPDFSGGKTSQPKVTHLAL